MKFFGLVGIVFSAYMLLFSFAAKRTGVDNSSLDVFLILFFASLPSLLAIVGFIFELFFKKKRLSNYPESITTT